MANPTQASKKLTELLPRWVKGLRKGDSILIDPITTPGELYDEDSQIPAAATPQAAEDTPPPARVLAAAGKDTPTEEVPGSVATIPGPDGPAKVALQRGGGGNRPGDADPGRELASGESVTRPGQKVSDSPRPAGAEPPAAPARQKRMKPKRRASA